MTPFQLFALLLTAIWLLLVVALFRRSTVVLVTGLCVIAGVALASLAFGKVTLAELGLGIPISWLSTLGFALVGLVLLLAYSPLADRLASNRFHQPPTLGAFRGIQRSWVSLLAGILVAWLLGGVLEELIARGIVLTSIESWLSPWTSAPVGAGVAVILAAFGAGLMHIYQGPRAAVIIAQLSVLFGILFVVSGNNLWIVIICHGLYDTIAFVRFATKRSKYSDLERREAGQ